MWKLETNTPKRLPTWVGGKKVYSYFSSNEHTPILNNYSAENTYLTAFNFIQQAKLPFLLGFILVSLGQKGFNNSQSRNPTIDLNACYYLTPQPFSSQIVTIDFYFADLNSYTDLNWVKHYAASAVIYKDREPTPYKVSDLKA